MTFALFTTLLATCPFESSQPMAIRYLYCIIFTTKSCLELPPFIVNFRDIESIKLTWGVHVSSLVIKNYGVGLNSLPSPP
jgi:hypothetical protein